MWKSFCTFNKNRRLSHRTIACIHLGDYYLFSDYYLLEPVRYCTVPPFYIKIKKIVPSLGRYNYNKTYKYIFDYAQPRKNFYFKLDYFYDVFDYYLNLNDIVKILDKCLKVLERIGRNYHAVTASYNKPIRNAFGNALIKHAGRECNPQTIRGPPAREVNRNKFN